MLNDSINDEEIDYFVGDDVDLNRVYYGFVVIDYLLWMELKIINNGLRYLELILILSLVVKKWVIWTEFNCK